MGLHSISNQCFHNIFASLFLQNFICIPYTVSHLSFCAFVDFQYKCVLYYDPTIGCHTQEFAIFAAIAYCVLAIFIIYPTILFILYPTRLFRKCVLCCGFRRWHAVHMFVESFQGQYKDGTNGTHDFRMVSASFLILRILILFLFLNQSRSLSHTLLLQGVLFACATCIHAITRPY